MKEEILEVPSSAFPGGRVPKGFGMDIGGTLTKVAYVSTNDDTALIHLLTYPKHELKTSISKLNELCSHCLSPGLEVYTTGVGCNEFQDVINEGLNVKSKNVMEMACQVEALKFFVKNFSMDKYIYPRPTNIQEYIDKELAAFALMAKLIEATSDSLVPWSVEEVENTTYDLDRKLASDDIFPCLLCTLGSGAFYTVLEADGQSEMVDINTSCGKMFMGLGSLLIGAKTYDELIQLAQVGDSSAVETKCKHIRNSEREDVYSLLPDDTPIYCFGQTCDKQISDFKREDLASALVSQLAQNLAQSCHLAKLTTNVKSVLFNGTLCETELIRAEITKHFVTRNLRKSKVSNTDFYFIKNGSHLGALGCLLVANAQTST